MLVGGRTCKEFRQANAEAGHPGRLRFQERQLVRRKLRPDDGSGSVKNSDMHPGARINYEGPLAKIINQLTYRLRL